MIKFTPEQRAILEAAVNHAYSNAHMLELLLLGPGMSEVQAEEAGEGCGAACMGGCVGCPRRADGDPAAAADAGLDDPDGPMIGSGIINPPLQIPATRVKARYDALDALPVQDIALVLAMRIKMKEIVTRAEAINFAFDRQPQDDDGTLEPNKVN